VVGEAAKRPLIKIETKIVPKAVTLVLFTIAWLKLCSSANLVPFFFSLDLRRARPSIR
jgi:hypothetical protein